MIRAGIMWLPILVLGGVILPGAGYAQRSSDGELALELLQRIERLESEVRQMRGELEIYRYQLDQWERGAVSGSSPEEALARPPAVESAETDPAVEEDLSAETDPSVTVDSPPTTVSPTMVATPSVTGMERADFDAALDEFREGRFREAIMGFQQFLSDYPESRLAGDARYWLGESHYLRRNYDAAMEAFIDLGLRDPQSARLPDALLKLGYLYGARGDIDRAREVLQKLVQVYPDTQAASLAERRLESLR